MKILFVCTGNTCRSPMAEKILKKLAKDEDLDLEVKSAGVAAVDGYSASKHAISVLNAYGAESDHITSRVSKDLLDWADIVLTMTSGHKELLHHLYPEYIKNIYTLKQYVHQEEEREQNLSDGQNLDIADPFGGDLGIYQQTAKEIEHYLIKLIAKFRETRK